MQEIITYLIIVAAASYTIYSFVKVFIPSKNKTRHLCSGGCSGCSLNNKSVSVGKLRTNYKKINL